MQPQPQDPIQILTNMAHKLIKQGFTSTAPIEILQKYQEEWPRSFAYHPEQHQLFVDLFLATLNGSPLTPVAIPLVELCTTEEQFFNNPPPVTSKLKKLLEGYTKLNFHLEQIIKEISDVK